MYGPADFDTALERWRYVDLRVNTRVPGVHLPLYGPGHITTQTLSVELYPKAFNSGIAFYQLSDCYWIPWLAVISISDGNRLADTRPIRVRPRRWHRLRLIKGGL